MIMSSTTTHSLFRAWDGTDPLPPPRSIYSHSNPEEGSLQQFARETSLHGLVHVVNKGSSRVQRCLWTFAFYGCLCFLIYHSISGINYYFQFHHITKLEENVASEKTFPAITFCNINPLRKSALTTCDLEHLREVWHISTEHTENIASHMCDVNRESFNGTKAEVSCCGQFDWKRLYDRSAHRLWDMVKSCRFKKAHCTAEDFESKSIREWNLDWMAKSTLPPD